MKTVTDSKRGCGWRKPGGLYLRSEGVSVPCGRMPLELKTCPCCSAGIKFARGWTWINPALLFAQQPCTAPKRLCSMCPLNDPPARAGLLWIGEKFYTASEWLEESHKLGVSRRIQSVPKGFKLGETWVFVAHIHGITTIGEDGKPVHKPAIFHAFKPTCVEYVTKGNESQAELEALEKRGITPVKVIREGEML